MSAVAIKELDQSTEVEVQLKTEAKDVLSEANGLEVKDQTQMAYATDVVKLIQNMKKEAENDRTGLTAPLNAVLRNINARYKPISDTLEKAEKLVKGKILAFQSEEARKVREQQEKERKAAALKAQQEADAQRNKGNEEGALELEEHSTKIANTAIVAPSQMVSGTATGAKSTLVKRWNFEVDDIAALAAARPDLVIADGAKIRKLIAAEVREIPGVRIFQTEDVSIR